MTKRNIFKEKCVDYILDGYNEIDKFRNNIDHMPYDDEEFLVLTKSRYIAETILTKIEMEIGGFNEKGKGTK